MASKMMDHDCVNVQQDAIHGRMRRVMNKTMKDNEWRCTACGKTVTKGGPPPKKSAK